MGSSPSAPAVPALTGPPGHRVGGTSLPPRLPAPPNPRPNIQTLAGRCQQFILYTNTILYTAIK